MIAVTTWRIPKFLYSNLKTRGVHKVIHFLNLAKRCQNNLRTAFLQRLKYLQLTFTFYLFVALGNGVVKSSNCVQHFVCNVYSREKYHRITVNQVFLEQYKAKGDAFLNPYITVIQFGVTTANWNLSNINEMAPLTFSTKKKSSGRTLNRQSDVHQSFWVNCSLHRAVFYRVSGNQKMHQLWTSH